MKVYLILLLLGAIAWPLGCSQKEKQAMQAEVAFVNNEPITVAELLALAPEGNHPQPQNEGGADEERAAMQRALLDHLIERKMLLQEAKRLKIQLSNAEIAARVSELYAAMDEQAALRLKREEESEARRAFEAATRDNLLIEKFLNQLPVDDPTKDFDTSEEAMLAYYEGHPSEWQVGEQLKLRQIVTETKEEAEALYLRLLDGADFEETAKDHSKQNGADGGELGYLHKEALPIEFDSLFRAEIGEVSPVIKTEFGYHIVRVEDRRPARTHSFKEVRDRIARNLRDQKREALFSEWISKLRQRTEVKINGELLKKYS